MKRKKITGIILIMLLLSGAGGIAYGGQFEEYTLKAVYLERIARFMEWPGDSNLFVIGVLGENPFGSILEDIYGERKIKSKSVTVKYFAEIQKIETCHLLYVSKSKAEEISQIVNIIGSRPILTVGDTTGFCEKGVLVNLYIEGGKLRFEINESGLHEAGLTIDPLLLKVVRIVNPQGGKR